MKLITLFSLIILSLGYSYGFDNLNREIQPRKNYYELINDIKSSTTHNFFDMEFTARKTTALIISALVPGSGQTYLGEELKGMGISLAFYGTALTAVIAHNNAQGREDRLKVLTQEYNTKGNYNDAEKVWRSILSEKAERDNDYDRRTLFTWLAVGVWIYNIVDVIFLTSDHGENEFAADIPLKLDFVSYILFNGVALKINLP